MIKPKPLSKFHNIQALRGIAALMVVIFHLHDFEKIYGHGLTLMPSVFDLLCSGVDIFFVISGFIMVTITFGQFQQPGAAVNFLLNRITRIYPLYWFFTLITFALLLLRLFFDHSKVINTDIIRSFLLMPQAGFPLLPVGWTLVFEMYFYLIITFLLFFPEKMFSSLLAVWAIFILTGGFFITNPTLSFYVNPLCWEFIGGCLIARLVCVYKINTRVSFGVLFLGILSLLLSFGIYHLHYPDVIPANWSRVAVFGIPSMLIVYGAVGIETNGSIFPSLFVKLGDISYSIYLSHYIIESGTGRLLGKIHPDKLIYHLIIFIVTVFAVIGVSVLSYNYLEKPLLSYFRNLRMKKFTNARVNA